MYWHHIPEAMYLDAGLAVCRTALNADHIKHVHDLGVY